MTVGGMMFYFLLAMQLAAGVGGDILGPKSQYDELFVYQEKIYAVHQLLENECRDFVRMKRDLLDNETSIDLHLEAAEIVYHRLIAALEKCRAEKATTTAQPLGKDCQDLYEKGERRVGIHLIQPLDSTIGPFNVSCDFFDGHGWTVIQKRFNGSVDFYQNWTEYKNGFGDLDGEHWLGNDKIHELTKANQKLNVYAKAANGHLGNGYYPTFYVDDESDGYKLTLTEDGYFGNLPSGKMLYHNGMKFTTKDRDNDVYSTNCAVKYLGAWWYKSCYNVNLNGRYSSNIVWIAFASDIVETTMRVTRN